MTPSRELEAKIRKLVAAESAYPTVTPASSSRVEVSRPPTLAMSSTAPVAASAPRNAVPVSELEPRPTPKPNRIAAAAPVEAPEDTPRMNGSASTLRTRAWSATPLTASPAPTIAPSKTRGLRTTQTMLSSAADQLNAAGQPSVWCPITCHTVTGEIGTGPRLTPAPIVATTAAPSPPSHQRVRLRR